MGWGDDERRNAGNFSGGRPSVEGQYLHPAALHTQATHLRKKHTSTHFFCKNRSIV